MKLESVQLERQVNIHGQESKCFSVEPVLRCLPGCFPVKTTTLTVGYHCLPVGESARNHSWFKRQNLKIWRKNLHVLIALLLSHCRFRRGASRGHVPQQRGPEGNSRGPPSLQLHSSVRLKPLSLVSHLHHLYVLNVFE